MQRDYELMVIVSPQVPDEEMPDAFEQLRKTVADLSGDVVSAEVWGGSGKRRLAYAIDQHREGTYYLMQLKLESTQTEPLERSLRLNERVIRHLLVHAI